MLKKIRLIIPVLFSILVCTTCDYQLNVKDFIEKGFDVAKFSQGILLSRSVIYNSVHYVPSGETITVTIPIGNRHGQELSGVITLPPGSAGLFISPPRLKQLTPHKVIIEFQFKNEAEPKIGTGYIAQPIPMTLTLDVKDQGRSFGSLTIPLYCNTAPVKPAGFSVTYNAATDSFLFPLPAKTGIHEDLDRIEAAVTITPASGQPVVKKTSIPLTGTPPNPYELQLAALFGNPPPSGKRVCKLTLYDKTGLSVQLADTDAEHYEITGVTFTHSVLTASWGDSKNGIELPMISELQQYTQHSTGTDALADWRSKGFTVTAASQNGKITFTDGVFRNIQTDGAGFSETVRVTVTDKQGVPKVGTFAITVQAAVSDIVDVYVTTAGGSPCHASKQADGSYLILIPHGDSYTDADIKMSLSPAIELEYQPQTTVGVADSNPAPLAEATGSTKQYSLARNKLPASTIPNPHQTCRLTIKRDKNHRAFLSGITINGIPLAGFVANIFDYTAPVLLPAGTPEPVPVAAVLANSGLYNSTGASITINDISANQLSVPVSIGSTQPVSITVTPEKDTAPAHTYIVNLKRKAVFRITFKVESGTGGNLKGAYNGTEKTASGTVSQQFTVEEGNSVTFTAIPDNGYEVDNWSVDGAVQSAAGLTYTLSPVTASQTVTVKLRRAAAVIKGSEPDAWKKLKAAVAAAQDGDTIIIDGEVKATNATGNNGEIPINKNLTIQGKTGKTTDILNADKDSFGAAPFRIFKVEAGKKLTLKNLTLKGGKNNENDPGGPPNPNGKGGAVYSKGELEIRNVLITECEAKHTGGGIYCKMAGSGNTDERTFLMEHTDVTDCKVSDPSHGTGGGVYISGDDCLMNVKMTNVKIEKNKADKWGAGLHLGVSHGAKTTADSVVLTNVTLEENELTNTAYVQAAGGGGMIFSSYNNTNAITLKECTITKNTTHSTGGGIKVREGTLILENCTIKENEAEEGGGVYAYGTVKMDGGAINVNKAERTGAAAVGGGVLVMGRGTFTMSSGEISGNTAASSGFTSHGGGVCVVRPVDSGTAASFIMTGGTISGNTAVKGGGVSINNAGTFTIQGNAKIADDNDVYLPAGKTITVTGTLTLQDGTAGRITPENYTAGTQVLGGSGKSTEYTKFTVTSDSSTSPATPWEVTSTGMLQKKTYPVTFSVVGGTGGTLKGVNGSNQQTASGSASKTLNVPHGESVTFTAIPLTGYEVEQWTISPGTFSAGGTAGSTTATVSSVTSAQTVTVKFKKAPITINGSDSNAWKKLKDAVAAANDGDTIVIEGEIMATNRTGNNGEITINKNLTIKGKNGASSDKLNANKTVGGKTQHRIFDVQALKTLKLENLTLKGGKAPAGANGGGIFLSGSLELFNCTIEDCEASKGGAVFVSGGTLKMKGSSTIALLTGSDANQPGKNDVYLKTNTKITVDGSLTGTAPIARITPENYTDGTVVVEGTSSFTLPAEYAKKFLITSSSNANEGWSLDSSTANQLKLRDYGVFTIASVASGHSITLSLKENGSAKSETITTQPYNLKLSPYITNIKLEARCASTTFLKEWTLTGGGTPPSGYTVTYPDSTNVKGKTITAVFAGRSSLPSGFTLSPDGKTIEKYTGTEARIDLNAIGLGFVEAIANDAFRAGNTGNFTDNTILKEVVLPDGLKTLGSYAFFDCKALEKITIPKDFTGNITEVFPGCTALEEYVIPAGNPRYCLSTNGHLCSGKQNSSGSYDFNDLTLVSVVFKPSTHPTLKITDSRIKEIKNMAAEFHTFTKIEILGLSALSKIEQFAFFKLGGYEVTINTPTPPALPEQPPSVFGGATTIKVPSGFLAEYKARWTDYDTKIVGY